MNLDRPQSPHFRDFLIELRRCMTIRDSTERKKEIAILVEFFLQHEKTTPEEKLYLRMVKAKAQVVLNHMRARKN